jgi:hypothetical protein
MKLARYILAGVSIVLLTACRSEKQTPKPVLFEALTAERTGIDFANNLHPSKDFNMFHYMYYYNGAGVGAGDFNNDGRIDLFFASNESSNKLFLNKGGMKFEDITDKTSIPNDKAWNTGVSVVDINNDGLLDIYICRLGDFEKFKSRNQLLVCKGLKEGIPFYEDEAAAYGINFSGFSTQAAFFDYDMDGDLDMFLLNHSVHQNGTFAPRKDFVGTYHPLSGDRLFRNDGKRFTDVTRESKINSSAISFGLGVAVSDIDLDGWPDLYAGNDFHENDYLYINRRNGTFADEGNDRMMHTSQYTMGVDIADADNDGYPEIVSMDMLPGDPAILMRSLGEDDYDIAKYKVSVGYSNQFTRNNLQWNRRNGQFSETGMYSGIHATDWSWATLWMDFDNDGLKDLFVANGIPKRMNDMDYVNFVSSREIQDKIRDNQMAEKDLALIEKFPEIKIPNKFFRNTGAMAFEDYETGIKNNLPGFSNGAVYADLDNDGDLDLVVNNVNDPAIVYENKTNLQKDNTYIQLILRGPEKNTNAVGARLLLFFPGETRTYEKYPVRGFLSSMEIPFFVGMRNAKPDSVLLVWPDNTFQKIDPQPNKQTEILYQKGLPIFDFARIKNIRHHTTLPVEDITTGSGMQFLHKENIFQEFNREFLVPHMLSTEGPALAVADINKDGREDIFIGAARGNVAAVFIQAADGKLVRLPQPALSLDSNYEDTDALWADLNKDGAPDLVVASGGNEYYGNDPHTQSRVYLNDGKGVLQRLPNAIPGFLNASVVAAEDIDEDGDADLFLGARDIPFNYGARPDSYLLLNDGHGMFSDATADLAPELKKAGMVTHAVWTDMNGDKKNELLVSYDWGGIDAFTVNKSKLKRTQLTDQNGWWNFLFPIDIDQDGDQDLIALNAGLNTRLHPDQKTPIRLYNNDFDDNGRTESVMTYYLNGKEIPFSNKDEIQRQVPAIKKKFLYAEDYAKASLEEIFGKAKLRSADVSVVTNMASAVFINNGNLSFTMRSLPWQAQLTSYRTAQVCDANGDALPDILLMGNYYDNNIQMGRYDADYGTLLINKGKGELTAEPFNGLQVKGQVRKMRPISLNGRKAYVLGMNNDSARIIAFGKNMHLRKH